MPPPARTRTSPAPLERAIRFCVSVAFSRVKFGEGRKKTPENVIFLVNYTRFSPPVNGGLASAPNFRRLPRFWRKSRSGRRFGSILPFVFVLASGGGGEGVRFASRVVENESETAGEERRPKFVKRRSPGTQPLAVSEVAATSLNAFRENGLRRWKRKLRKRFISRI